MKINLIMSSLVILAFANSAFAQNYTLAGGSAAKPVSAYTVTTAKTIAPLCPSERAAAPISTTPPSDDGKRRQAPPDWKPPSDDSGGGDTAGGCGNFNWSGSLRLQPVGNSPSLGYDDRADTYNDHGIGFYLYATADSTVFNNAASNTSSSKVVVNTATGSVKVVISTSDYNTLKSRLSAGESGTLFFGIEDSCGKKHCFQASVTGTGSGSRSTSGSGQTSSTSGGGSYVGGSPGRSDYLDQINR